MTTGRINQVAIVTERANSCIRKLIQTHKLTAEAESEASREASHVSVFFKDTTMINPIELTSRSQQDNGYSQKPSYSISRTHI